MVSSLQAMRYFGRRTSGKHAGRPAATQMKWKLWGLCCCWCTMLVTLCENLLLILCFCRFVAVRFLLWKDEAIFPIHTCTSSDRPLISDLGWISGSQRLSCHHTRVVIHLAKDRNTGFQSETITNIQTEPAWKTRQCQPEVLCCCL